MRDGHRPVEWQAAGVASGTCSGEPCAIRVRIWRSIPSIRLAFRTGWMPCALRGLVLVILGSGLLAGVGCGKAGREVVVYAAQDRIFAEPIFHAFELQTGIRVLPLYDSEATKAVGLANRLVAERHRPQADLWWSNEEMRTRQLVAHGILEPGWKAFGSRRRVLVVRTNSELAGGSVLSLATLTNAAWRGRVAMAYPVFGTTTTHMMVLRQRWGESAWKAWCGALAANHPWVVDGNSVVVRLVGRGDADIGLTDSDDVTFGRREGLAVVELPLPEGEGLRLPNTVAFVAGARRAAAAATLAEHLAGPAVLDQLAAAGAIDPDVASTRPGDAVSEEQWEALQRDMDGALAWLRETFVR